MLWILLLPALSLLTAYLIDVCDFPIPPIFHKTGPCNVEAFNLWYLLAFAYVSVVLGYAKDIMTNNYGRFFCVTVVIISALSLTIGFLFNPNNCIDCCWGVKSDGFSKIVPKLSSVGLTTDGTFFSVLKNCAGEDIAIDPNDIKAITTSYNKKSSCAGPYTILKSGGDNSILVVASAKDFYLQIDGCGEAGVGDAFWIEIAIPYNTSNNGIQEGLSDAGRIMGTYESPTDSDYKRVTQLS